MPPTPNFAETVAAAAVVETVQKRIRKNKRGLGIPSDWDQDEVEMVVTVAVNETLNVIGGSVADIL